MSTQKKLVLPALFSVILAAIFFFVMLLSSSAVYAEGETTAETYKVNYKTYVNGFTIDPKTVGWDDADLNYKGWEDTDDPDNPEFVSVEEEFSDHGVEFQGWYTDKDFQVECTGEMKYSEIAKDPSAKEITLYAKLKHEHHGVAYKQWGYSDRLPDSAGNWCLMEDVRLSDYTRGAEAAWTVPEGETYLCLNGHNITREKKQDEQGDIECSVISVPEGAKLSITYCNAPGRISGGSAGNGYGGGIVVHGNLTMQQGVISGNTAANGGGIAVLDGAICELYFCNISNNSVPDGGFGGGVYVDENATLHLGSDSASTPKVSGNKAGDRASDVSIAGEGEWKPIEVEGLSSNSVIGIETRYTWAPPEDHEKQIVIANILKTTDVDVSRLVSNDGNLVITKKGEGSSAEAVLGYKKSTVTFVSDGEVHATQTVYGVGKATPPETEPTRDGAEFVAWMLGDDPYDFETSVTGDLTLTARFDSDHYHDGRMFTEWTSDNSLPTVSGSYYLTNDITLSSEYAMTKAADIHLCLNGHTITRSDGGNLITINGTGKSLSIYDCSDGETGKLTGGTGYYGAVYVTQKGSFTLNGGQITDNGTDGINCESGGNAVMNGGSVSNNTPDGGGEKEDRAGGIRACYGASFKMTGGTITSNDGPGIVAKNSSIELSGGSIIANTVKADEDGDINYDGAGIQTDTGSHIKISGTGKITIKDNRRADEESNVYLSGIRFSFGDGCVMNEESRIGVTAKSEPYVLTGGLREHGALTNFFSDSKEYQIKENDAGEAELYFDPIDINVSFDAGGAGGSMADATAKYNQDYTFPDCTFTPENGYEFDKWLIGEKEYEENATVKLKEDTVIKAKWKPIEYGISYNLDGGTMEEGTSNPETYTIESETITLTPPVKACYEFTGWTGTDLEEPSMEVTIPKGTTGDKAYTATWEPIEYTISYMLNGGKLPAGKTNPYSYTVESEDITLVEPVLSGSSFRGWYLMGSDMAEETKEMVIRKGSSGNKVFIALWGNMDHKHKLTPVAAKDATCETDGNIAYYVCSCGQAFLDTEGTKGVDPAKTADKGGVILPGAHKWDEGKITKEPTGTENGIRTFTCAVCGQTRTEEVSKADLERADAKAAATPVIGKAKAIKAGTYSARSYAAVASALKNLEKLLADDNANAAKIKSATEKLQKAIGALKMNQKLTVKKKTIKVKAKKLKKKARKVKPLIVKGVKTKVTYKGVGLNKKSKKALKINKKTGKITVKKKTKKGTYKMKVTVTAAGNAKYEAAKKTVTVIVKVRK